MYTIEIDKDFKEYTLENEASHEAGFDALMTGYVFFRSMNKLSTIFVNDRKVLVDFIEKRFS